MLKITNYKTVQGWTGTSLEHPRCGGLSGTGLVVPPQNVTFTPTGREWLSFAQYEGQDTGSDGWSFGTCIYGFVVHAALFDLWRFIDLAKLQAYANRCRYTAKLEPGGMPVRMALWALENCIPVKSAA